MSMSKKDLLVVAYITRAHLNANRWNKEANLAIGRMVLAHCDAFANLNPGFDRDRYLDAALPDWYDEIFEGIEDADATARAEEEAEPCCYGWVTSRGRDHEVDCPVEIAERKQSRTPRVGKR